MINEGNPSPLSDETVDNTTTVSAPDATVVESVDIETVDNVQQLREHAKGLKRDLDVYKPTHEFLTTTFGDLEMAKQAHSLYDGFTSEEFDPDNFIKHISQLSPTRANQLVEKLASERAQSLVGNEVEKMFGGKVLPEEIKLFKEWKESGYGLAVEDDIPDELKFNEDGTPKSEKEIDFLRTLQRQVKEIREQTVSKDQQEAQKLAEAQEQEVENSINTFASERLRILDNEFEAYGLTPKDTDTADQRKNKEFIRNFFINGVSGAYMSDPESSKDYASAIAHIRKGEPLLARKYEARIESRLLNIIRSDSLGKLLQTFSTADPTPEPRPEISTAGGSTTGEKPTGRTSADDIFKSLVERGALKL